MSASLEVKSLFKYSTDSLEDYQLPFMKEYAHFCEEHNILSKNKEKVFVEVGGCEDYACAKFVYNFSGAKINVFNPVAVKGTIDDNIIVHPDSAANSCLESGSVDSIYGICVIEHIVDLLDLAKEMYRILRYGGVAYFNGGPLWHSHVGHHVWVQSQEDENKYYKYTDSFKEQPIKAHEHLLHTQDSLYDLLVKRDISFLDARTIVDYVYDANIQNRYSHEFIKKAFLDAGFYIVTEILDPDVFTDCPTSIAAYAQYPKSLFAMVQRLYMKKV